MPWRPTLNAPRAVRPGPRPRTKLAQTARQIIDGTAPEAARLIADLVRGNIKAKQMSWARWEAIKLVLAYHLGNPRSNVKLTSDGRQLISYTEILVLADQEDARLKLGSKEGQVDVTPDEMEEEQEEPLPDFRRPDGVSSSQVSIIQQPEVKSHPFPYVPKSTTGTTTDSIH